MFVHNDRLSVRATITDGGSGNIQGRQGHLPFGEEIGGSGTTDKHKFTNYERDSESGLDYAVNRQYAQSVARFMRVDPYRGSSSLDNPQTQNRYAYVENDPINKTDPLGLNSVECVMDGNFCQRCTEYDDNEQPLRTWTDCPDRSGDLPDEGDLFTPDAIEEEPGSESDPIEQDACPAEKRRFFSWLVGPLTQMAKNLNTSLALLLTLAAKEGGWITSHLDHNQPLNNPFGVNRINRRGRAAGNVRYSSLDAAIQYWIGRFGDRVRGTKTVDDFINGLQHPSQGAPYNSATHGYDDKFRDVYKSVLKFMKICGIEG
ncbi:MAG TPA: RHS repeat-associated core domain-containing protein [Nitrososphaera sp.]|nr:RHS repeat-associated core domain-containing protein [Nitrososphaera sp.]